MIFLANQHEKKLTKKIKQLKYELETLPADARRKKDEKNWEIFFTIFIFTALAGIFIFGTGGWLAVALMGTALPVIIVESGLVLSVAIGFSAWPLYNAYLWVRDSFRSAEIKAENKQYTQLEKTIAELKKLDEQQSQLDVSIDSKLQMFEGVLTQTMDEQRNTEKRLEFPESKKSENVYPFFQKPVPEKSTIIETTSSTQRNLI